MKEDRIEEINQVENSKPKEVAPEFPRVKTSIKAGVLGSGTKSGYPF